MVSFLGFFALGNVRVELGLCVECEPVDAGEHLVFLIAAPVGAGDAVELETIRCDFLCGIVDMATFAEVDESGGIVKSNLFTLTCEFFDKLGLVCVPREFFQSFFLAHLLLLETGPLRQEFPHFRLNLRQIGIGYCPRNFKILIEAIVDCRPDCILGSRP